LHRGAIAVSRGDLDHRIVIAGGDELTDLATAFNQMTSTLSKAMEGPSGLRRVTPTRSPSA
jgi:nitrate/nitrite-specific signal transduction histidine kinase